MNQILKRINKELDQNRIDEWHCMIKLSEDGGSLVDDLIESVHSGNTNYHLVINEERQGFTEADIIGTSIVQCNEYIYHILKIGDGHGFMGSITRIDQKPYPDQVDPADEDHIYFNADPGEKPA